MGIPKPSKLISWPSGIRNLELDDAARRSVHRRRAGTLEYPEATEEVGFKGTMTLVGCSLLWVIILLVIVSRWVPWVGWLIASDSGSLPGFAIVALDGAKEGVSDVKWGVKANRADAPCAHPITLWDAREATKQTVDSRSDRMVPVRQREYA